MVKQEQEMERSIRTALRGGTGSVEFTHLMDEGTMAHTRLFAKLVLAEGASIGEHDHVDETEYYWILSGEGIVTEADGEKVVREGDLVITGGGASHAIRNEKKDDLVFLALIILE